MDTKSYSRTKNEQADRRVHPRLIRVLEYARCNRPPLVVPLRRPTPIILGRAAPASAATPPAGSEVIVDGEVCIRLETDDAWMSTNHARIFPRAGQWHAADLGSKNGTYVDGKRIEETTLRDGAHVEVGHTMFVFRTAANAAAEQATRLRHRVPVLRTANAELAQQLSVLKRIASAGVTVLLHGESGTGKELMARAIHELSARTGAFVAVNCGAIPASLLEAQLFGHKKGAFSGATADAPGLIRTAQNGTLFLDEIAELSELSQVALLRALQEKEVLPVGSTEPVPVDVRFLAATHQDLSARISAGRFREDLYARISGFIVELPPLRARMEDLGLLIGSMLQRIAPERADVVGITRRAANALFAYSWPRNIRELEATLAAALAITTEETIAFEHLPEAIKTPVVPAGDDELTPSERELHNAIIAELEVQRGNVTATAKSLGYSRSHFHRLLKRLGIEPESFRR